MRLLILVLFSTNAISNEMTDGQIRKMIIKESIQSYPGSALVLVTRIELGESAAAGAL